MGTQWQYKDNETYKPATRLIEILIETRAKGGSLLLNVGPKPDGELPVEQEKRLREIALWYFVNHEAVDSVRPWIIPSEDHIWFTRKNDCIYAFLTGLGPWNLHQRKSFLLKSVKGTGNTKVEILGQSDEKIAGTGVSADYSSKWRQEEDGMHISVVRATRLHQDHKYYNPVVIRISGAEAALVPPVFSTMDSRDSPEGTNLLQGQITDMGDAERLEAGFQYRISPVFGEDLYVEEWMDTELVRITAAGEYSIPVDEMKKGVMYQCRAVVKHPLITLKGNIRRYRAK
jgi:alpha-L-fucosidase